MLIIANRDNPARIYVPLNGFVETATVMAFSVRSTADNFTGDVEIEAWEICRENGVTGAFARLELPPAEDVPAGEYEYELRADGVVVSTGIVQICDTAAAPVQYEVENEYKQYGE